MFCLTSQVSGWINEKLQVALDESYRDPTNLQAKLQKHQAFEAELAANRNRVDAVVEVSGDAEADRAVGELSEAVAEGSKEIMENYIQVVEKGKV